MDPLSVAAATAIVSKLPWEKMLSSVADDTAKSALKFGIQGATKKLLSRLTPTEQEKSLRLTLQLFTESFLTELDDKLDLQAALPGYKDQLTTLLSTAAPDIAAHLHPEVKEIDLSPVRRQWEGHNLNPLPPDFNWTFVADSYARALRKHIRSDSNLREQLNTALLQQSTKAITHLAGQPIERDELQKIFNAFLRQLAIPDPHTESTKLVDQLKTEAYGKYWQDETWHEVLRRIAGMVGEKQAEALIQHLMAQDGKHHKLANLFLAAECLGEVRNRQAIPSTDKQLKQLFQEKVIRYDAPYYVERYKEAEELGPTRQRAIHYLATHWYNEDTWQWLKAAATSDVDWIIRRAAVEEIARGWKDAPGTLELLLDRTFNDEHKNVRCAVLQALATGWKDLPATPDLLKDRAKNDSRYEVRCAALHALANGWHDSPITMELLHESARNDKFFPVREAALQALAHQGRHLPSTLELLQDLARHEKYLPLRQSALLELARGWSHEPGTKELMQDSARNGRGPTREAALQALARGWKDEPGTKGLVQDRARNDEDGGVRRTALQELVRGWKDVPGTLELLQNLVRGDEDDYFRRVAMLQIALGWPDLPETLDLLQDLARNDKCEVVRQAALQELSRHWGGLPGTLERLQDSCRNEESDWVRQAALQELARGWGHLHETLLLLQDLSRNDENWTVRLVALQELARRRADLPMTLKLLQDRALNDDQEDVRQAALRELARGWRETPETLDLLQDRARNDENEQVRKAAREELNRGWPDLLLPKSNPPPQQIIQSPTEPASPLAPTSPPP